LLSSANAVTPHISRNTASAGGAVSRRNPYHAHLKNAPVALNMPPMNISKGSRLLLWFCMVYPLFGNKKARFYPCFSCILYCRAHRRMNVRDVRYNGVCGRGFVVVIIIPIVYIINVRR